MNQGQVEAAIKAMSNWLSNPHELGRIPVKIQVVEEFDLHELHYYVFKYKKSVFGKWLLGVCGGYDGNSTEHCGHIFSEMREYRKETANQSAIEMVEMIRSYWMGQAK